MNKKELLFTFHSDGTYHTFSALKSIYDPYEKRKRNQLDMMRDLVAFRDSPTVFIVDSTGHVLK